MLTDGIEGRMGNQHGQLGADPSLMLKKKKPLKCSVVGGILNMDAFCTLLQP